jgi:hypothetical protein
MLRSIHANIHSGGKRRELLNGKLLPYCKSKGHEQLKVRQIDFKYSMIARFSAGVGSRPP